MIVLSVNQLLKTATPSFTSKPKNKGCCDEQQMMCLCCAKAEALLNHLQNITNCIPPVISHCSFRLLFSPLAAKHSLGRIKRDILQQIFWICRSGTIEQIVPGKERWFGSASYSVSWVPHFWLQGYFIYLSFRSFTSVKNGFWFKREEARFCLVW